MQYFTVVQQSGSYIQCLERSKHVSIVDIRIPPDSNSLRYSVLRGYWNKENDQLLCERCIKQQQIVQLKIGTLL